PDGGLHRARSAVVKLVEENCGAGALAPPPERWRRRRVRELTSERCRALVAARSLPPRWHERRSRRPHPSSPAVHLVTSKPTEAPLRNSLVAVFCLLVVSLSACGDGGGAGSGDSGVGGKGGSAGGKGGASGTGGAAGKGGSAATAGVGGGAAGAGGSAGS